MALSLNSQSFTLTFCFEKKKESLMLTCYILEDQGDGKMPFCKFPSKKDRFLENPRLDSKPHKFQ